MFRNSLRERAVTLESTIFNRKTELDGFVLKTERESIASQGNNTVTLALCKKKRKKKEDIYFSFNSETSERTSRGSGGQSVRGEETWKHQGTKT